MCAAIISAHELMAAFATPFPSSNSLAPASSGSSYFYSTLLAASPPAASNIPVRELMDAFTSVEPLAPIICPPAVYSRRPCLTPRADGTTVDSLEDFDYFEELPVLSVQVVRYTAEQVEEQESTSAPTCAELFPEYNVCPSCKDIKLHCKCEYTLPPGIDSFKEYCYQCKGNIMECKCEEDGSPCDKCKWQDLATDFRAEGETCPNGFNKCFCDLLIEYGNCPECLAWECQCLPEEEEEYDGQDEVFQLPSWRNADMM
jgi:hypothetical protein